MSGQPVSVACTKPKTTVEKQEKSPGLIIISGQPKENFCLSAESRKGATLTNHICRNTERTERNPFCRKRLFLPKECLSAEIQKDHKEAILAERDCFCRKSIFLQRKFGIFNKKNELHERQKPTERGSFCRKRFFLPKERVSADRQKEPFLSEILSAEFLPKISAERAQEDPFG